MRIDATSLYMKKPTRLKGMKGERGGMPRDEVQR